MFEINKEDVSGQGLAALGSLSGIPGSVKSYKDYAFYTLFGPGRIPIDKITKQAMTSNFAGKRVDAEGNLFDTDEPVIDSDGLHTYGPFENLMEYSEDISHVPEWYSANSPILTETTFKGTTVNGSVYQYIPTVEGNSYTLSFKAHVEPGGQTEGYTFRHTLSADGNVTSLTLSEVPTVYSITVLGASGGGNVHFGFRDDNTSDWAEVTITDFQVTETAYKMPYCPTNTLVPVEPVVELVTNGDFSAWTDDELDSWNQYRFATDYVENSNGGCRIIGDGERASYISQAIPTVTGKVYRVTVDVLDLTTNTIKFAYDWNVSEYMTAVGTYTFYFTAIDSETVIAFIRFTAGAPVDFTIDNVSIIEVESVPTAVVHNYSDADEGYKFQITPDEIGGTYTGPGGTRNMGMPDVLDALDGKADGTDHNVAAGSWTLTSGWSANTEEDTLTCFDISTGASYCAANLVSGTRYEAKITAISGSGLLDARFGATWQYTDMMLDAGESLILRATADGNTFRIQSPANGFLGTLQVEYIKEISPAQGELVVEWMPKHGYDDSPLNTIEAFLSFNTDVYSALRFYHHIDGSGRFYIGGASSLSSNLLWNWEKGVPLTLTAIWGEHPTEGVGKMQLKVTDGSSVTEAIVSDFNGSFEPTDHLMIGWANEYWQSIKSIKIYKEPQSW